MENIKPGFFILFFFCLFYSFESAGQVVVHERPREPVISARPSAPAAGYVWVSGEYVWKVKNYVYVQGYWAVPPAHKTKWVEGRWRHRRGGWIWIPGFWK